jgi:hypothetical protein
MQVNSTHGLSYEMRRSVLKIAIFVLVQSFLINFNINMANSAGTVVVDSTLGSTCKNGPYTSGNYAQLFTAGTSANISEIRIQIGAGSTTYFSNSMVKIFADNSLMPSTLLATFSPSSVTAGVAKYVGSLNVTSGTRFWIFPTYSSGNTQWCYAYPSTDGSTVTYQSGWTNTYSGSISSMYFNLSSGNGTTWGQTGTSTFLIQLAIVIDVAVDTTAPTFTSSTSFSTAENIATSANAATIKVSESATVTISSGADAARFNIARSETNTAIIKFNASPDFEAPADVGGNNVYEITLTATDAAANAGTQSITITVTDVVDTSSFNSLTLAGSATTATYRTVIVITANITVASKVTFRINGKILPGCKNRSTTGSSPNIVATCSWRPSNRGVVSLTASAAPTGAGISSATSTPLSIMVGNRAGSR